MNLVNPLAAFADSYQLLEGLAQDRTRRQAGNALAQGDYQGASGALLGRGMFDEGMGVQELQQGQRDRMAEQEKQLSEQQKAAAKERAGRGIAILTRMRSLPPEQIDANYQSFLRPYLAETLPPEMLARIDAQPKTPENVDLLLTALGAEAEKLDVYNTKGGIVGVQGGEARMIYEAPQKPVERPRQRGPDGIYELQDDGKWKKVASFGAAPKVFAPPRKGGGGQSAKLPSGFILDGQ